MQPYLIHIRPTLHHQK